MTRLLLIDRAEFDANFASNPYLMRHVLTDHPLLTVERIALLADALAPERIEHNVGAVPAILPGGEAARADLSPGEIARTIETNGNWLVLKNIETDPEYRALLNETLDEVAPLVADREGGMRGREGFIFLSAPDSVTPAHVDPEHNFLLQVRGTKTIVVGGFPNPESEQRELERIYRGGHRNLESMFGEPREFALGPGEGVYVPVNAPHLVRNGPTASVSLSITWRTPRTAVVEKAHVANAGLRALGLSPSAPGRRPRADRLKAGAARTAQGVWRRVAARRS